VIGRIVSRKLSEGEQKSAVVRFGREVLIFLIFCLSTAALTWPYVMHLRDAVVDAGDPGRLTRGFMSSIEYAEKRRKR
jgi:hypothetical protein